VPAKRSFPAIEGRTLSGSGAAPFSGMSLQTLLPPVDQPRGQKQFWNFATRSATLRARCFAGVSLFDNWN